jgi:hypothetical protein
VLSDFRTVQAQDNQQAPALKHQSSSTMTIIDKISEKLGGKHEKHQPQAETTRAPAFEAGEETQQRHKGMGEKVKEAVGLEPKTGSGEAEKREEGKQLLYDSISQNTSLMCKISSPI